MTETDLNSFFWVSQTMIIVYVTIIAYLISLARDLSSLNFMGVVTMFGMFYIALVFVV